MTFCILSPVKTSSAGSLGDLSEGVHDVGVGMVDCLRKIRRGVLVVFAPHEVYIGVRVEVALLLPAWCSPLARFVGLVVAS